MNWITIIWPMIAATCFTLAGLHLMIGLKRREELAHLLYATFAAGVACFALFELQMTQAASPDEFGFLQRWIHLPAYVLIVASIWSFHFFFGTGSARFAWGLTGFFAFLLAINFSTGTSINYQRIEALRMIEVWGGVKVPIAQAVVNPWSRLEALAFVGWILFMVQATVQLWRRGDRDSRRKAAFVGGSFLFLGLVGAAMAQLRHEGLVDFPYLRAWVVFAGLLALGYELSSDVFRATELARQVTVTEAGAREQAERLRLAVTGGRLALWDWDMTAGTVYLSGRWQEMVGGLAQPVVIPFRDLAARVHPEDFPVLRRHLHAAVKGQSPDYEVDHRVRTQSGEWIWIHSRGEVVSRDANGRALRMSGVNEDITARRQAEERFRLVVEAFPNAMVMVDRTGTIALVNAQAEKVFGYEREELLGRSIEVLVAERFRPTHSFYRDDYLRKPAGRAMGVGRELFARRKDGSEIPVEVGLNPIQTSEGTFILASVIDITQRRDSEADLARQRNELAHLSRVAMLGELSGSLAHELNQPLAAILSNAQAAQRFLARNPGDITEVSAILQDIVDDDKRAGEVIRRLRALLKKEDVEHQALDVNEVVLDVLRLMRSDLVNRGVSVSTQLAPALPAITGDRVQLQQVLINLVINGCDALEGLRARERQLSVRTTLADGHVEVAVADCGKGITPEQLERVFEPFVTTKTDGMGLGLAVCRTIVHSHSGKIWASRNGSTGTTFRFTLPVPETKRAANA